MPEVAQKVKIWEKKNQDSDKKYRIKKNVTLKEYRLDCTMLRKVLQQILEHICYSISKTLADPPPLISYQWRNVFVNIQISANKIYCLAFI